MLFNTTIGSSNFVQRTLSLYASFLLSTQQLYFKIDKPLLKTLCIELSEILPDAVSADEYLQCYEEPYHYLSSHGLMRLIRHAPPSAAVTDVFNFVTNEVFPKCGKDVPRGFSVVPIRPVFWRTVVPSVDESCVDTALNGNNSVNNDTNGFDQSVLDSYRQKYNNLRLYAGQPIFTFKVDGDKWILLQPLATLLGFSKSTPQTLCLHKQNYAAFADIRSQYHNTYFVIEKPAIYEDYGFYFMSNSWKRNLIIEVDQIFINADGLQELLQCLKVARRPNPFREENDNFSVSPIAFSDKANLRALMIGLDDAFK